MQAGGVAKAVEVLPSKHKVLTSSPNIIKRTKNKIRGPILMVPSYFEPVYYVSKSFRLLQLCFPYPMKRKKGQVNSIYIHA
jgi:hypothetical protein